MQYILLNNYEANTQTRELNTQACEEFKAISRKLYDKPNCIEELSDMREWMKGIPDKLKEHQVNCVNNGGEL